MGGMTAAPTAPGPFCPPHLGHPMLPPPAAGALPMHSAGPPMQVSPRYRAGAEPQQRQQGPAEPQQRRQAPAQPGHGPDPAPDPRARARPVRSGRACPAPQCAGVGPAPPPGPPPHVTHRGGAAGWTPTRGGGADARAPSPAAPCLSFPTWGGAAAQPAASRTKGTSTSPCTHFTDRIHQHRRPPQSPQGTPGAPPCPPPPRAGRRAGREASG